MRVEFRRTGQRRYALTIHRAEREPLEFGGPGWDDHMPHDLLHLIVEQELGLRRGIFGFMASGGHAGDRRRDKKMLRRGARDEGPTSERATFVCWYEWLRRSSDAARRERAREMADGAKHVLAIMPADERRAFSEEFLARVCRRMDELSARWTALAVGDSFSVEWSG